MPVQLLYLLIFLLVFQINVLPAFMPPTWLVLAFFYLKFDANLIVLVLIGAAAATLGRIILAKWSGKLFRNHLPKMMQKNYLSLGVYFTKHNTLSIPIVIAYAFLPIPSNQVFIAAGLANVNIRLLAGSFFVGRLISYTFWVSITSGVSATIAALFAHDLSSPQHIFVELVGLGGIILVGMINWRKLLR